MPVAPDAILQDTEGRSMLRFERTYSHSPERVWRALTESAEQRSWHPTPFEFEPRVGGQVTYLEGGDVPEMPAGEVVEFAPPRLLAHTWDTDLLRWQVEDHEGGCRLILTHTFDDRFKAARDAAGWHVCLDSLAASLEGRELDHNEGPWRELNTAYQERFGISPEEATPIPGTES